MFEDTPLVMVEDESTLRDVAATLARSPVIGIDTESDSSYAYQEKVSLIQVSDLTTDFIIDPLSVPDLSPLKQILADPTIVKVLHGADYDIVCLRRDHDFHIRGLFDTLIAAQFLNMERIGLADLIGRFFGVPIDKKFQRHNWGLRPLQPEHIEYARGDTHYLLALREIMLPRLRRMGRIRHQEEECGLLEVREWKARPFDPEGWVNVKGSRELDERGLHVLRHLYRYRDAQGRRMNQPVYKVIPDGILVNLAARRPETRERLEGMMRRKSALLRRHGKGIINAIHDGLDDDDPLPRERGRKKNTKATGAPPWKLRLRGRQAERVLAELKDWRAHRIRNDSTLTPFTVASNGTLKWVASLRPRSLEELSQVPDVRAWQVRDFGEDLLELLDRVTQED